MSLERGTHGILGRVLAAAESLREEDRELRRMSPTRRGALAFAFGDFAIDATLSAHGLDRDVARQRLERAGQAARRQARVMRGGIG